MWSHFKTSQVVRSGFFGGFGGFSGGFLRLKLNQIIQRKDKNMANKSLKNKSFPRKEKVQIFKYNVENMGDIKSICIESTYYRIERCEGIRVTNISLSKARLRV